MKTYYIDLTPLLLVAAVTTITGCVAVVGTEDAVVNSLKASGDIGVDAVAEHKADPNTTSSAQESRRYLARERTRRHNYSILDSLFREPAPKPQPVKISQK